LKLQSRPHDLKEALDLYDTFVTPIDILLSTLPLFVFLSVKALYSPTRSFYQTA